MVKKQEKSNSLNSVINEISEVIDMVKDPLIKRKLGYISNELIFVKEKVLNVAKKYPYPDIVTASYDQIKTAREIFSELFTFL